MQVGEQLFFEVFWGSPGARSTVLYRIFRTLQSMESLDVWLFYAINHGWSNPILDVVMPVVTSSKTWLPIYAALIAVLLWRGG